MDNVRVSVTNSMSVTTAHSVKAASLVYARREARGGPVLLTLSEQHHKSVSEVKPGKALIVRRGPIGKQQSQ